MCLKMPRSVAQWQSGPVADHAGCRMRQSTRGFITLLSLELVTIFSTVGLSFLIRSFGESHLGARHANRQAAFYLAEAGVDRAWSDLQANAAWGGVGYTTLPAGGGYEVSVEQLGDTLRKVTSIGHFPSNAPAAFGYQRRRIEAVLQVTSPSVFRFAVFGEERVRMKVNDEDDDGDGDDPENSTEHVLVDSYDSSLGGYLSQIPGHAGHIGTNSIEDDSVRLRAHAGEGSITVHGQVVVGPGLADPSTAVELDGNVTVSGMPPIVSQSQPLPLPAVSPPAHCQGNVQLKEGETLTLFEGSSPYCVGKLELKDQASLQVVGNVVVYASQLKVQDDAQVNAAGRPTQLIVQITSEERVKLQDHVVFVGGLYAPQSKVKLKDDVTLFGSIIAERVKLKEAAEIHYDEALRNVGPSIGGSGTASLTSWRELGE